MVRPYPATIYKEAVDFMNEIVITNQHVVVDIVNSNADVNLKERYIKHIYKNDKPTRLERINEMVKVVGKRYKKDFAVRE